MRKLSAIAALSLALAFVGGSALAADLSINSPAPMAPAPVGALLFSGLYVGVHGGGGWAGSNTCVQSNDFPPYDYGCAPFDNGYNNINMAGPYVGGQVGYDFAVNSNWRLGIEGDLSWSGISGSGEQYWSYSYVGAQAHEAIDWFGTLNGRIGYVMGNWMPYVTGGLAFGGGTRTAVETSYFFGPPGFPLGTSEGHGSHVGWDIGVGAEWAISQHWSLKGEYKYIDLGRANYALTDTYNTGTVLGVATKVQTFEVGLNYRF